MKKISMLFGAVALMFAAASCEKKSGLDLDNITLDGFYVYGDATGSDKVLSQNAMTAGINEVTKETRSGMFEKYIYLQANKDFALIENLAGNKKFYGAEMKEVNFGYDENDTEAKNFADNPNMKIQHGKLIVGEKAPALRVKEDGLYHIVLDNNTLGDLGSDGAQIIIQKADFGVRGAMNGWGFTPGEAKVNTDGTIVYTWKDQELAPKGEFKFSSCNGWKINLDENGTVKAEVSFGLVDGVLGVGPTNIAVDKGGLYDITLTYSPKAGKLADSFSYNVTLTQESTLPTEMYMIGAQFGNWEWASSDVVSMIPAHSEPGVFWAIRYIPDATKGFKFCAQRAWNGDFAGLDTNEGFTMADGNCFVSEAGTYMFEVDMKTRTLNVHKAAVYAMGDMAGGNWDEGKNPYTVAEDGTMSFTATAAGTLRTYAASALPGTAGNWWHREFTIAADGTIAYRAAGDEKAAFTVAAGDKVVFDFNANTGKIAK